MSASYKTKQLKSIFRGALACLLTAAALLPCFKIALAEETGGTPAAETTQDPGVAPDVTMQLSFDAPLTETYYERLADEDVTTITRIDEGKSLCLHWTDAVSVQGFWIQWKEHPAHFLVEELNGDAVVRAYSVIESYDNRWLPVSENCRGIRLTTEDTIIYSSLRAYGPGTLPEYMHDWEPPAEKADILLVVAHPDDEQIFLGGIVPYYVGEKGLAASVMLMTCSDRYRYDEAENGLWTVGLRTHPIFAGFKDVRTNSKERILKTWVEKKATGAIVEEIRRCKPEVVVTHDIWGEYGHGAHRACSYLLKRLIAVAADPEKFPESAEKYGAWQVQKLYFHAWRDGQKFLNQVTMNWDVPLEAFNGRTAREMAAEGYACHKSQSANWADNMEENRFDCAIYSLVLSEVGPDVNCNDLLENIDPARLTRPDYTPPQA